MSTVTRHPLHPNTLRAILKADGHTPAKWGRSGQIRGWGSWSEGFDIGPYGHEAGVLILRVVSDTNRDERRLEGLFERYADTCRLAGLEVERSWTFDAAGVPHAGLVKRPQAWTPLEAQRAMIEGGMAGVPLEAVLTVKLEGRKRREVHLPIEQRQITGPGMDLTFEIPGRLCPMLVTAIRYCVRSYPLLVLARETVGAGEYQGGPTMHGRIEL